LGPIPNPQSPIPNDDYNLVFCYPSNYFIKSLFKNIFQNNIEIIKYILP
jgi:hypothetical protein